LGSFASSTSTATAVGKNAGRQFSSEAEDVELRDLAYLNSNLKLGLAGYQLDGLSETSNSRVEDGDGILGEVVGGLVGIHDHDFKTAGVEIDDEPVLTSYALDGLLTSTSYVVEPENDHTNTNDDTDDTASDSRADSHASFHLTKNNVSSQLRSMSQLSGHFSNSSELPMPADTWTFHYRERGNFLSASAINLSSKPGQALHAAREHDASSSVYSRPTSPEADQVMMEDREPYELSADLVETTVGAGDWPLKQEQSFVLGQQQTEGGDCCQPDGDTHITIVEPVLPAIAASTSTPTILEPAVEYHDGKLGRAPSHKSSSSSTTKRSRFFERFTPPKKLVTKRRSIFKFLRAGSHRDQTRSISTPVLCSPHLRPYVDGPADENEHLTVQYELTVPGTNPARSVSLGNLAVPTTNESQGVASSPDLRLKPSLAEYERHLSIVGDDRRRNSTAKDYNLNRLSQIEEDDKNEHVSGKNSFSYHSKPQMTDPLMEAALERQLREKAMFRSTSKRSIPQSEISGTSFVATSWDEPSTAQPQSPDRDPLDVLGGQRPSASHLSPPRTPVESRSRNSSFVVNTNQRPSANGKKPMILHTPSSISRSSIRSKIGSSLDSWSRYPSHTRGERCASAGRADNVRTLDFALDINHERIRGGTDESDPFRPGSRARVLTGKHSSRSKTKSLPKSRSATFGGTFARYYSTLFSSPADFHGKGRRTSVAIGGKLHRPELEILAPVLPSSSSSPVSGSALSYVHELEQILPASTPNRSTPVNVQTGGSGGKGKSPLLSNNGIHHLQGSDSIDPSRPPAFRGDSMFKPLSSEVPEDSEKTLIRAGQETSQPDGSEDYFSARMGSSSKSNSQASLTIHTGESENLPTDVDGTIDSTDRVEINPSTRAPDPTCKRSTPTPIPTPSKSQAWSDLYQECLVVPPSPVVDGADGIEDGYINASSNSNSIPDVKDHHPPNFSNKTRVLPPQGPQGPHLPLLRTPKLRSPTTTTTTIPSLNPPPPTSSGSSSHPTTTESDLLLSTTATFSSSSTAAATIRRYPSVTVIDDRKGHWRSVSFVSVVSNEGKSVLSGGIAAGYGTADAGRTRAGSREGSFGRENEAGFVGLMQKREREERERLLGFGVKG